MKLPNGRTIKVSKELGQGAEGVVHAIQGTDDLCAKIYFEPASDIEFRLKALKRHAAARFEGDHGEHVHLAWPRERLLDNSGDTIGFVMPRIEAVKLSVLTERDGRFGALDSPTWGTLVTVAERTARLVNRLHGAGVVVGDLSPANVLVTRTGHVTLIDCDTVQFTDPEDRRQHRCRKLTPRYAPPGAAGLDLLTEDHDDFGLALLVTELLMVGQHPFDGVPVRGMGNTIEENIKSQNNRIAFPERLVDVPNAIPATVLPPDVRALATTCFGPGHRDPVQRPDSRAWTQALSAAVLQVMGCRNNANHAYHRSLQECVWCERVRAKLGDTFPASQRQLVPASGQPETVRVSPRMRPIPVPLKPTPATPPAPVPINVPVPRPAAGPRPVPAPAASGGSSNWVTWIVVAAIVIFLIVVIL